MKKALTIVLIALALGFTGYQAKQYFFKPAPEIRIPDAQTERQTTLGPVVGYQEDNRTHAWLGIPFAKPPVGDLRWKAPRPPEPWKEPLEAVTVCAVCTQYGSPLSDVEKKEYDQPVGSEDCLYLNIHAPAFSPETLPKGDPLALFRDETRYNPVPLIIGTNRDEFKLFMAQDPEFVNRWLGIFVRFKDPVFYQKFAKYRSDLWKAVGVDAIAQNIAESNGESVFTYRFDWDDEPSVLGMDMGKLVGAAHGLEIPFVFNSFDRGMGLMKILFTKKNEPGRIRLADAMSSYWAEFAYTGSPGKGRNRTESEWKPWDDSAPDTDKFIVFDTPDGGGIRMSRDTVGIFDLKARLLSDSSFPQQRQHCQTYVALFDGTPLWSDDEYAGLGKQGCADCPKENFRRTF